MSKGRGNITNPKIYRHQPCGRAGASRRAVGRYLLAILGWLLPLFLFNVIRAQSGELHRPLVQDLLSQDPEIQMNALTALRDQADPSLVALFKAMEEGSAYRFQSDPTSVTLVIVEHPTDDQGNEWLVLRDPLSGDVIRRVESLGDEAGALEDALTRLSLPSADARRMVKSTLDRMKLFDSDAVVRRGAATKLGNEGDDSACPAIESALKREADRLAKHAMQEALFHLRLGNPDPRVRREAATRLGDLRGIQALTRMKELVSGEESDPEPSVRLALQSAIQKIENHQSISSLLGILFNGVSLGSILLMMGLGLAITFGLMGVINMAHGEMMMVGGYTGFVIQEWFTAHMPAGVHDHYFLIALPFSFLVAGAVGWLLEKTVIRFLYGRPLETLLATWGISMVFQQGARVYFGDLTSVNAPSWLRGGAEPLIGLVLPYGRIFIIGLSAISLIGVHLLLTRTRLGLRIRAVTQNRDMSACLGVSTRKVDGWTFALGAGLAGLAGCSLNLIGTVDPEVGKYYIVESFMVVVVGGVGKLAGTLAAALGIGMSSKILEPLIGGTGGSIYAKLAILAAIILFLQRKPSGIFAPKGRAADLNS